MQQITINSIIKELNRFGITDKLEQAHFLAQIDHESTGLSLLSENTKYRFARARAIWPNKAKAISEKQAELAAGDGDICPQPWLFNLVYGNRMGCKKNGGDGNDSADYCDRSFLRVTGEDNSLAFLNWLHGQGKQLDLTINNIDEFLHTTDGTLTSALYHWQSHNINNYARIDDVLSVTKAIDGGTNGLNERKRLTGKYKILLRA